MCIEHIICMHSIGYVNNMWLQVDSYINSRKMCILGQLHILRVLNVWLAGFALPAIFHLALVLAPNFLFLLIRIGVF